MYQKIASAEFLKELDQAIKRLPPKHRKLIEMIYFEKKKRKAIALEMDLALSTVTLRKTQALQLLREQLSTVRELS